jgi:benzoyl-CoA 2,3-dioxygenase component B
MEVLREGRIAADEVPLRNAMNEVLRDDYVGDCEFVCERWNRVLEKAGRPERMTLPHRRFNREVGLYAGQAFDPAGNPVSREEFERRRSEWLPTPEDLVFVRGLMKPCLKTGTIAAWIAPPAKGIDGKSWDWEYVRFDRSSAGVVAGGSPYPA